SPSPAVLRAENRFERGFPGVQSLVELGVGDHERAEHAHAVPVDARLEEEQTALERRLGDAQRELRRRLLRPGIADELEREHRTETPDVADLRKALLPGAHPRPHDLADLGRALDEPFIL